MRFQSNSHNRTEANGAERSAAHCNGIELQRLGQLSVLPSLWTLRKLQPKRSFLIPCAASLPLVQTLQCFQGRDVYPNAAEAPKQHNVSQSELSPALLVAAIHQVTPRGMLATPRLNAPEVSKFAMVPGVPDVVYKHGMIYAVDRCGIRKYNSVVCFAICDQCNDIFFRILFKHHDTTWEDELVQCHCSCKSGSFHGALQASWIVPHIVFVSQALTYARLPPTGTFAPCAGEV